jgi:uncharacterized membrane protein YoaK (UPF0700 family)
VALVISAGVSWALVISASALFVCGVAIYSWGVRKQQRGLRVLGVTLMLLVPLVLLIGTAFVPHTGET